MDCTAEPAEPWRGLAGRCCLMARLKATCIGRAVFVFPLSRALLKCWLPQTSPGGCKTIGPAP